MSANFPSIGPNVRRERQSRKLSLEELSESSGVSKAMLSQIESGKVNPTVMTMWKIAQALKVDFNVLIKAEDDKVRRFTVCRREDLTRLDTDDDGVAIKVLTPLSQAEDLELYCLTMQPGSRLESTAHYENSEEYVTVLSGDIQVSVGKNEAKLHTGDVLIYQCDIEHRIINIGNTEAKVYLVVRFCK